MSAGSPTGVPHRPPRRVGCLEAAAWLSPAVRSLRIKLDADSARRFEPLPGQWVAIELPLAGRALPRAYSIASPVEDLPEIELIVSRIEGSPAADYLCKIEIGTRIAMTGPFGTFVPPEPLDAPVLLVAADTGVAPFRPMIRALLARPLAPPAVTLLFGAETEGDLLYREEFESLAIADRRFVYGPVLSQPSGDWPGARGDLLTVLDPLLAAQPSSHIFACGLRAVVEPVRRLVIAHGFPRHRFHFERYD